MYDYDAAIKEQKRRLQLANAWNEYLKDTGSTNGLDTMTMALAMAARDVPVPVVPNEKEDEYNVTITRNGTVVYKYFLGSEIPAQVRIDAYVVKNEEIADIITYQFDTGLI